MGGQVRLLLEEEKEREGVIAAEDRQGQILREHDNWFSAKRLC